MVEEDHVLLRSAYRSVLLLRCSYCHLRMLAYMISLFLKIFIVAFLGLFSFVVLFDFYPYSIYLERRTLPKRELILHICLWSVIFEEFCQVEKQTNRIIKSPDLFI